jgi:hypothetical protein
MRSVFKYFIALLLLFFLTPRRGFCYKPKTHLYLALRAIQPILQGSNKIEMGGLQYEIDSEIALVIREYPGYYLGGVIGPDGFPDIMFGQMIIHPDTRCGSKNGKWVCDSAAENSSWSWEWFEYLYKAAKNLQGEERKKALSFVMGYITHGAGDMWAHTFVNYFAGGAWPANLAANRNLAIRHIIVEGVIGKYTPDIQRQIDSLGGIKAPIDFIIKQFFNDPWARKRSSNSFSGLFLKLRDELIEKRSKKIYLPLWPYLDCWIEEINKGLQDWPLMSFKVANDLFVRDEIDTALAHITDFEDEHLYKMLSVDPISLVASCKGHPEINIARSITAIKRFIAEIPVIKELQQITGDLKNFLFTKVYGISIDSLKNYIQNPELYLDTSKGFFAAGDKEKILELISIDSTTGYFNENGFAIAHNTIQICKLIFLGPEQLDRMLFDFNAGPLYTTLAATSSKKENVMLGFIRSLDGNHQWRSVSPPLPVQEPSRQFSEEMPLWTDCLARTNFFKKIFHDWEVSGISIPYYQPADCISLSSLPPVTANYDILYAIKNGDTSYYSSCGEQQFLQVTLINHQRVSQNYSVYISYEVSDSVLVTPFTHAAELIPDRLCINPYSVITTSQLKYYMDSCLVPNTPATVIAQFVINGSLPAISGRVDTVIIKIPLLKSLSGAYKFNVYLLEKLNSPELPILNAAKNSLIKRNEAEYLTFPVNAAFSTNLFINCQDCPTQEILPCLLPPQKNN